MAAQIAIFKSLRLLLVGYLKYVVYYPLPKTWADLKINLEREIKKIPENILKKDVKKLFP